MKITGTPSVPANTPAPAATKRPNPPPNPDLPLSKAPHRPQRRRNRLKKAGAPTGKRSSRPGTSLLKWKTEEREANAVSIHDEKDEVSHQDARRRRRRRDVPLSARKLAAVLWRLNLPDSVASGVGRGRLPRRSGKEDGAGNVALAVISHRSCDKVSRSEAKDPAQSPTSVSGTRSGFIFRSIAEIIQTCHSNGVMHRDIKPENFMLSSKNVNDSLLKAIDFGYSEFIERGKRFEDVVGSAYYIAPEVLHQNYGKEVDIWSAGVMLYILLSGMPPFRAETKEGIFAAIKKGKFDLETRPWPSISASAKDLIKKMLTMDAGRRIIPSQILEHPWLKEGGEASDKPLDAVVIVRLKQNRLHSRRFRYN